MTEPSPGDGSRIGWDFKKSPKKSRCVLLSPYLLAAWNADVAADRAMEWL